MKALFVGLGSIGQRHLRNLQHIRPDIEIGAVRSTRSVPVLSATNQVISGAELKSHYGIREFDSLEKGLAFGPDLVFVTNPTSLHAGVSLQAVRAGAFVFVEKPLSHTWDEIENLVKAEKQFGSKKIAVGYHFRFLPVLKMIRSMLLEGKIGNLTGVQVINGEYMPGWHPYEDYRNSYASRSDLGGGALVTQIHDFDNILWLLGKPKSVYAVGGKLSSLEIDVEDSVQSLFAYPVANGTLPVSVTLDYLQWPPVKQMTITGDNGKIVCDLNTFNTTVSDISNSKTETHSFPKLQRNDLFLDEMKNFLAFAEGKEEPVVDLHEGMASLEMALACKESMLSGKPVEFNWGEE